MPSDNPRVPDAMPLALPARQEPLPARAEPVRSVRDLWIETGVVFTLGVLPSLAYSLHWAFVAEGDQLPAFAVGHTILRALYVAIPVLYLIHRSGEPWSRFGFLRPRWAHDAPLGVALLVASYVGYVLLFYLCWYAYAAVTGGASPGPFAVDYAATLSRPAGWLAVAVIVVMGCTNGFAEELVMRAYLIPRFARLLGGGIPAVLLSAVLFAAYHAYQGLPGVLSALALGLVFGTFFCRTGRIWPLVAAHALADILPFVAW